MFAQLFGVLLFACQIILNGSSVIHGESAGSPTARPATLPQGYVSFPADHAAYKIYTETVSWNEARERCVSQGARLAVTDSFDKVAHVVALKTGSEADWIHVGIHYSNATGQWVGVDNDLAVASVPWSPENPDDTGKCAGISISDDGLSDYLCDTPHEYYVCEIPL